MWVIMVKIQLLNHRNKLLPCTECILKYIQIENLYCFCCSLDQINAGLVSRRDLKKCNPVKILLFKHFWLVVCICICTLHRQIKYKVAIWISIRKYWRVYGWIITALINMFVHVLCHVGRCTDPYSRMPIS